MPQHKWQLHRAGLLNYWYYDDQELHFVGGRLLLRGDNGSGKSVTMQSFIPLLLDGKKSPDRLDPFGSRARKMEDYLLGEQQSNTPDERTGYLYLEFKMGQLARYLTIGIGLKAKRGQSLDSWGFSITDNRRIGHDLFLYKKDVQGGKVEKIPLSYRELENLIGTGGQVVKGQDEYMKMVNQLIFGFESIEKYEELIKLLIQLRSPKLSKDFRPTVIYEILNNALPALSDDDLRTLSETLENMDNLGEQVEHLEKQYESVKRLEKAYTQYNKFLMFDKAHSFMREVYKWTEEKTSLDQLVEKIQTQENNLVTTEEQLRGLEGQLTTAEQVLQDLEKHDAISAAKEKNELLNKIQLDEMTKREKESRLSEKERQERSILRIIEETRSSEKRRQKNMVTLLAELDDLAEEGYYTGHSYSRDEFEHNLASYASFGLWKDEVAQYLKRLDRLVKQSREVSRADKVQEGLQRELGEISAELESRGQLLQRAEKVLEERKSEFLTTAFHWQAENRILTDLTNELQEISLLVPDYPEVRYEQLRAPIIRRFDQEKQRISATRIQLEYQQTLQEQELKQIQTELDDWKKKEDPEPTRHPDVLATRAMLKEQHIPHVPLFAAVEFRAGVTESVRAQLESTLQEAGLLDTLILSRQHEASGLTLPDGMADAYFIRSPQILKPTLADFLEPSVAEETGIMAGDVEEILRSIVIDDEGVQGETWLNENGLYGIGLKAGKAPAQDRAIFIGREARRKYRQVMINQLTLQVEEARKGLQQTEQALQICTQALQQLHGELASFPEEMGMKDAFEDYDRMQRIYRDLRRQQDEKNQKWKTALEQYQQLKRDLQNMLIGEAIPPSEEAICASLEAMRDYQLRLGDLQLEHNQYLNDRETLQSNEEKHEELLKDLDEFRVEIRNLRQEIKRFLERIQSLETLMQELGIEEIQRQMDECLQLKHQLPRQITELHSSIGQLKESIRRDQEDRKQRGESIERRRQAVGEWETLFLEEAALQYYIQEKAELDQKPTHLARKVIKELQNWVKTAQLNRQKVTDRLFLAYRSELDMLQDYHLNLEAIFVRTAADPYEDHPSIFDQAQRSEITVLLHGKKASLYGFYQHLGEELKLKQELMDDEDRRLYEDIILKGLGRTIQNKIQRASIWVKEMNRLMEERDTSSGLTFSLQWVSRGTRNEQEMSADELVDLLKRDPRLLRQSDVERLMGHFRSRIQEARAMMEEKGYQESLHKAITEVLDYRQWFRFVLNYQKEGQRKKELTNHVFDTFSGGEKAMAMYIPLFSAVYSHYTQARDDAPRLISLDEAFAGVDENNIRDMFALVEQLGFNFVMNSQILWGDYDTIPELAIAELIRPKNARCVSVIQYYWNGKVRELRPPAWMGRESEAEVVYAVDKTI